MKLQADFLSDKVAPAARDSAHAKFQEIAFAYAVLSDDRRRKRYDDTGSTSETLVIDDVNFDWHEFFKAQWADTVTQSKLDDDKKAYQGSEEERRDVIEAYKKTRGWRKAMFERIMHSNPLYDEVRFGIIIETALKAGEVEMYDAWENENDEMRLSRHMRAEKESKEAGRLAEELGLAGQSKRQRASHKKIHKIREKMGNEPSQEQMVDSEDKFQEGTEAADLQAIIWQRQENRAIALIERAEKMGIKRKIEEPPEEAFEANRRKSRKTNVARTPTDSNAEEDAEIPKIEYNSASGSETLFSEDLGDDDLGEDNDEDVEPVGAQFDPEHDSEEAEEIEPVKPRRDAKGHFGLQKTAANVPAKKHPGRRATAKIPANHVEEGLQSDLEQDKGIQENEPARSKRGAKSLPRSAKASAKKALAKRGSAPKTSSMKTADDDNEDQELVHEEFNHEQAEEEEEEKPVKSRRGAKGQSVLQKAPAKRTTGRKTSTKTPLDDDEDLERLGEESSFDEDEKEGKEEKPAQSKRGATARSVHRKAPAKKGAPKKVLAKPGSSKVSQAEDDESL